MTGKSIVNSKTKRVVFTPRTPDEKRISDDFKKLCLQDDVPAQNLLLEAFELLFKVHHWPPGNPQLTLEKSLQTKIISGKCVVPKCPLQTVVVGVNLVTKKESRFCRKHFVELPQRHDAKIWKWKQKESQQ